MSPLGQKRRFDNRPVTSGLPPTSDIADSASHVGFVPTTDMAQAFRPTKQSANTASRNVRDSHSEPI
jgi:hypothetical protein